MSNNKFEEVATKILKSKHRSKLITIFRHQPEVILWIYQLIEKNKAYRNIFFEDHKFRNAIINASGICSKNQKFLEKLIEINPINLNNVPKEFYAFNKELALKTAEVDHTYLNLFSKELSSDMDVLRQKMKTPGGAIATVLENPEFFLFENVDACGVDKDGKENFNPLKQILRNSSLDLCELIMDKVIDQDTLVSNRKLMGEFFEICKHNAVRELACLDYKNFMKQRTSYLNTLQHIKMSTEKRQRDIDYLSERTKEHNNLKAQTTEHIMNM